jgi:thioredoxin 1
MKVRFMISKRQMLQGFAFAVVASIGTPLLAGPVQAFDQARFDAARASGAPVLVMVAADWCPTCRAQSPIIARIGAEAAFSRLQIFRLDFDTQKPQRRALRASRQSTLIAYKGSAEVSRSVGATTEAQIRAIMQAAIS